MLRKKSKLTIFAKRGKFNPTLKPLRIEKKPQWQTRSAYGVKGEMNLDTGVLGDPSYAYATLESK